MNDICIIMTKSDRSQLSPWAKLKQVLGSGEQWSVFDRKRVLLESISVSAGLFVFSLTRACACGRQQKTKKHTLITKGYSFEVPMNTRRGLPRTPHGVLERYNSMYTHRKDVMPYTLIPECLIIKESRRIHHKPCAYDYDVPKSQSWIQGHTPERMLASNSRLI